MNFLLDLLPILFVLAVYGLLYPRLFHLVKKIKIEQLPQEIIDELKIRFFPEYYKYFYFIWGILWMIVCLSGILIIFFASMDLFFDLQMLILGRNTIYFASSSQMIFGIIMFFVATLWWGGLSFFLMWRPLPKNFSDYLRADSIKKWNWGPDEWAFVKYLCKLSGLLFLVFIPIFYLAFNNYVAVSRENIIYHQFFSVKLRTYSFNEVDQLNVSLSQFHDIQRNSKNVDTSIKIIARNGDEIKLSTPNRSGQTGLLYNSDTVGEFYKIFRDQGIMVNIEKLSAESVKNIQLFCPDKQKLFYAIFEVNYQIVPHNGCL